MVIVSAANMAIDDLFTILRVVSKHPELITYTSEDSISGTVGDLFFEVKVECGGFEARLMLNDGSIVSYDINPNVKEEFERYFKDIRRNSTARNYTKLLTEIKRYEIYSNTPSSHQPN